MADVQVISKTIVQPESYEHGSDPVKIHLTPWDLLYLQSNYAQRGLIFPQPDPETNIISQLKSSLSLALNIFYPYAGRLVKVENKDDETTSFYIDCDGSGVTFIHASALTISVSDVLKPADGLVPSFINGFLPVNGVKNLEITEPLLAVQVTELKDGVFIGYGSNHMVGDGASLWSFFKTWSEICRTGSDRKMLPPLRLSGWFLDGIDYPIRIPISETVPSPVSSSLLGLQDRVFRLTSKEVSELKAKANDEVDSDDRKISSLQAVLAHLWRSIIRNSDLNPEEVVHCKLLVDMRRRLNPQLEKECFGNVVGPATTTITVGEMLNNGLGWVALQINKSVGLQTDEEFRVFAEKWVKEPKVILGKSNSINVSSSPWFNVYGNDFGWGKPVAIRGGPESANDGKLIIYSGIEGNIEIQASLMSHVLSKISNDAEFLKYVYAGNRI
ncbi:unnamed protein product [Eruca vesicaria subsp. sativa]|uniref:HXXXD-type acyl-transferase family protein n=1 Tax=Eruca vesicaria subsp. sativa TaxID=29727 RepID=A0ABC8LGH0_ERUVS|nr:unnamed protein product [Eruca vesicaria subsp. sativa]